jgi:hypothetical protein
MLQTDSQPSPRGPTENPEEIQEKLHMSDKFIVIMIITALIALIFVWVPFLSLVCSPCTRLLERRRQKNADKKAENATRTRPLSARRIGLRLDLDN